MAQTKDLAELLSKIDADKYKLIIERATLNGYHDYKFDKVPGHPEYGECICPKMQLVDDLSKFEELAKFRQDVIDGVYDEPADKEDQEEMRGWLIDDNSPDAMFTMLGFEPPTKEERELRKKQKKIKLIIYATNRSNTRHFQNRVLWKFYQARFLVDSNKR